MPSGSEEDAVVVEYWDIELGAGDCLVGGNFKNSGGGGHGPCPVGREPEDAGNLLDMEYRRSGNTRVTFSRGQTRGHALRIGK